MLIENFYRNGRDVVNYAVDAAKNKSSHLRVSSGSNLSSLINAIKSVHLAREASTKIASCPVKFSHLQCEETDQIETIHKLSTAEKLAIKKQSRQLCGSRVDAFTEGTVLKCESHDISKISSNNVFRWVNEDIKVFRQVIFYIQGIIAQEEGLTANNLAYTHQMLFNSKKKNYKERSLECTEKFIAVLSEIAKNPNYTFAEKDMVFNILHEMYKSELFSEELSKLSQPLSLLLSCYAGKPEYSRGYKLMTSQPKQDKLVVTESVKMLTQVQTHALEKGLCSKNYTKIKKRLSAELYRLSANAFKKFDPKDFRSKDFNNSSVAEASEYFNGISSYFATLIVRQPSIKESKIRVKLTVDLAKKACKKGDLQTAIALAATLAQTPVERLFPTMNLSAKMQEDIERLKDLGQVENNAKIYRMVEAKIMSKGIPVIPYIGIATRDVTFAIEGNKDFEDGKINWNRNFQVHQHMVNYQKRRNQIKKFSNQLTIFELQYKKYMKDEKALYENSYRLTPRGRSFRVTIH